MRAATIAFSLYICASGLLAGAANAQTPAADDLAATVRELRASVRGILAEIERLDAEVKALRAAAAAPAATAAAGPAASGPAAAAAAPPGGVVEIAGRKFRRGAMVRVASWDAPTAIVGGMPRQDEQISTDFGRRNRILNSLPQIVDAHGFFEAKEAGVYSLSLSLRYTPAKNANNAPDMHCMGSIFVEGRQLIERRLSMSRFMAEYKSEQDDTLVATFTAPAPGLYRVTWVVGSQSGGLPVTNPDLMATCTGRPVIKAPSENLGSPAIPQMLFEIQ